MKTIDEYWVDLGKNPIKLKEKLIEFLLNKNISIEQFEFNIEHFPHTPFPLGGTNNLRNLDMLIYHIIRYNETDINAYKAAYGIIDWAFVWGNTHEGDTFWRQLSTQWQNQKTNILYY